MERTFQEDIFGMCSTKKEMGRIALREKCISLQFVSAM